MANSYLFTEGRQGYDSSAHHYGYVYYTVTETNTAVTVTLNSVGERMTVSNSSYSSYSYSGASTVTATLDSDKTITATNNSTRRCTSQDTYYSFGGTAVSKTFNKGTSATTKALSVSWTWLNTTKTGSTTISIPALASYSVSYNANGGTNAPSAQTKYYGVTLQLWSDVPTAPSGFIFQGWGTSTSDTTVDYARGVNYTANAAITLYAIWKKDITLSYSMNGGSGGPSSETKSVYARTGATNPSATFTIPSTVPTKTDYRFTGWSDGTNIYQPSAQLTLTSNKALTAQWTQDYVAPKFTSITAYRTQNTQGTTNDGTGKYCRLIVTWDKATLAGVVQATTFTATYRDHTSSATPTSITTSTGTSVDTVFGGNALAVDHQYDIFLTLSCTGHDSVTYTTYLSTEDFTIDINANGKAIGLLQVAPDNDNGVFVGGDIVIIDGNVDLGGLTIANDNGAVSINSNRVADFVVSEDSVSITSGGTGTWYYRIWKSGWQEAWYHGSIQFTAASSTAGGWNRSTQNFALPIPFADESSVLVSGAYSGRVFTTGGIKTNGTQFEAQILGGQAMSSDRTLPGWNVYVAGYGRS